MNDSSSTSGSGSPITRPSSIADLVSEPSPMTTILDEADPVRTASPPGVKVRCIDFFLIIENDRE